MNVWRRGPLLENPYYRTAFRVARVRPEDVQHRALVKMIGSTRRLVAADPQAHTIQGRPVTEADINVAEGILLDARQRIVEELLEHPTEQLPLDGVRRLMQDIIVALAGQESGPLPVVNWNGLFPLADVLLRQFLAEKAVPVLGALELEVVPPYGRAEEG